ncbi:MAG: hypothetical protein QM578_07490 [Pantoea sp.]|uniref:hypothetical protein n=1 Tax=Pantoea sp. TaxID=69393 RepID=UPI0039E49120
MAVTEKLILFTDDDYGDIGEADSIGYYDVTFTFVCVEELSNAQAVCRFTMEVNGVLLNKLYRLGVAYLFWLMVYFTLKAGF